MGLDKRREATGTPVARQPRPDSPGDINVVVVASTTSAELAWTVEPGGLIDSFTLHDDSGDLVATYSAETRSATITSLSPLTTYTYSLVAHGRGDSTALFTFTTASSGGILPLVTGVTNVSVVETSSSIATLNLTAVGNGTSYRFDVLGDGLPSFTQASATIARQLPRGTSASTVTVQIWAIRGTAESSPAFTAGPYTIPAQPGGGGNLPTRTVVNGHISLSANQTERDRHRINRPSAQGIFSTVEHTGSPIAKSAVSTAPKLINETVDGNDGQQGVFANTLYAEDVDVIRCGGGRPISGTTNPNNGHFWYARQGIWRRITMGQVSTVYPNDGSYSLHQRAGSISGNLWCECYDMTDNTNLNAYIGSTTIEDILYVRFIKLGGGEMIIGGFNGGNHVKAVFQDCQFNNLRLTGSWSSGLTFINCTRKASGSFSNQTSGAVNLSGLRAV